MPSTTYLITSILLTLYKFTAADYWSDRDTLLAKEASRLIGSSIQLSEDEKQVNSILMEAKLKEYDAGFADPSKCLSSLHFFHSKEAIDQSEVFKFIQRLPKGASLHTHSSAMLSFERFFNLTYMDGLYGCDRNGTFVLHFFPGDVDVSCDWKLLSDYRRNDSQFDQFVSSRMTLVVDDPVAEYGDINVVWDRFQTIFGFIKPLFNYKPFLQAYLSQVLQEYYDDNIRYLEIRGGFGEIFDENNNIYNASQTIQVYLDAVDEFKRMHPDFLGIRTIFAASRSNTPENLHNTIQFYLQLKSQYAEFIAGFDLVGQEDTGQPLTTFVDELLAVSNQTDFFFHAGETNWYGSTTDNNLIDAVLLETKRIGHGFAITKHPEVLAIIQAKGTTIEVNPISNQVLKLVDDLRNHIGVGLIADGHHVVITCDDPTFWGSKALSYDWYLAFMGMTPRDGDLRILKQLALNSFLYSSLDGVALTNALNLFEGWWNDFIQDTLAKRKIVFRFT